MRCPICKNVIPDSGDQARHAPFCSDRCKLIDLGRWLDGKYQIPVTESDPKDQPDIEISDPPPPREA